MTKKKVWGEVKKNTKTEVLIKSSEISTTRRILQELRRIRKSPPQRFAVLYKKAKKKHCFESAITETSPVPIFNFRFKGKEIEEAFKLFPEIIENLLESQHIEVSYRPSISLQMFKREIKRNAKRSGSSVAFIPMIKVRKKKKRKTP